MARERKPWWRRFRVRISVRALIVVVLVVGGGLGWFVHRARVQREAVAVIQRAGGKVFYNWPPRNDDDAESSVLPPGLSWLIDALGIDYFGNVVELYSGVHFTDEAMGSVGRLNHLEYLSFTVTEKGVTRKGLAHLRGLRRLKRLNYDNLIYFTNDFLDLEFLRDLPQLEELEISSGGALLKDGGLAPIASLTRLRDLDLSLPNITDAKLADLRALQGLRRLRLGTLRRKITDAGLAHLGMMTHLESLEIEGSRITTLKPIGHLTRLKVLNLKDSSLTNEGLTPVANFSRLEFLGLDFSHLDDDGLVHLLGLPNLTQLDLQRSPITDAGLARLAGLKSCQEIAVSGSAVTDAGKAAIEAKRPGLRILR